MLLDVHVELRSISAMFYVVSNVGATLTSFVDASCHCGYAKTKSIVGAVSFMYVLVQRLDVQPFVVEGRVFTDCSLK